MSNMSLLNYLSFEKRKINYHPSIILVILMGTFFFIGEYVGDIRLALIAGLSPLVIVYFSNNVEIRDRLLMNSFCLLGFTLAYFIGAYFSFNTLYLALALGIYSTLLSYISSFFNLNPPKYFLFIMIATISSASPYNQKLIIFNTFIFLLGGILSILFAYAYYGIVFKNEKKTKVSILTLKENRLSLKKSLLIGTMIFSIYFFGKLLNLPSVHWIAISFTAILQVNSRELLIKKGVQRIFGTILGGIVTLFLFPVNMNYYVSLLLILILQFTLEIFMQKNYLVAVIFITPLTILMTDLSRGYSNNIVEIAFYRLICIIIGSVLALGIGIVTLKE